MASEEQKARQKARETLAKQAVDPVAIAAKEKAKAVEADPGVDFQDGGLYYIPGLKYTDAIFVDNDGSEHKAKVCPIPSNKGAVADVPSIEDPQKELANIARMSPDKQVAAIQEYQTRLGKPDKGLILDGKIIRLMQYGELLLYAQERQSGEGMTARTIRFPVANLLVNFSKDPKVVRWVSMISVRPVEHVPGAAKGEATIPHFKLA